MRDRQEAEDVVQEALIKIWNQRNRLDEYLNFDAWCMKLVRNQALDRLKSRHYRGQIRHILPDTASDHNNPYQHTELANRMQTIHRLIDSLPDKQREVIHLRDVEGFSYQEVAEIMNIDLNMVKVCLFRARNTIKTKLINTEAYGTR